MPRENKKDQNQDSPNSDSKLLSLSKQENSSNSRTDDNRCVQHLETFAGGLNSMKLVCCWTCEQVRCREEAAHHA